MPLFLWWWKRYFKKNSCAEEMKPGARTFLVLNRVTALVDRRGVLTCITIMLMQRFDRITWNPNQMNGQPCIRGMRLTVRRVVEAVALYPNRDDLFRNYPELEPDDVQQALAFAAANLEDTARETTAA
jgi:uncharacterized protein (DUF433 family)